MKATIFTCLLIASSLCVPNVYTQLSELQETIENASRLISVKNDVPLEPLIQLLMTQLNNYLLYTAKTPLLVDSHSMQKLSDSIKTGNLNVLYNYNVDDTTELLKILDTSVLSITNTKSNFKSLTTLFKSGVETVRTLNARINAVAASLTDAQLLASLNAMLGSLHDRTLKNVHDAFDKANKLTLIPLSKIDDAKKIIDSFKTKIALDKKIDSDYVENKVDEAYKKGMQGCHTICIYGYKNRIKGDIRLCEDCVHDRYQKEYDEAVAEARAEIDAILGEIDPFNGFFSEWEAQAACYTTQYDVNMSQWDIMDIRYQTM